MRRRKKTKASSKNQKKNGICKHPAILNVLLLLVRFFFDSQTYFFLLVGLFSFNLFCDDYNSNDSDTLW